MKKHILYLSLLLVMTAFTRISAQSASAVADTAQYPYWIAMMQDPNANFFQIQRAFNIYWTNRPITKGCGWKPFKRWESSMQWRISADGRMPAPDAVKKAFDEYMLGLKSPASIAGNWVSQGPSDLPADKGYKGIGRVNAIAFHPTNPDIIYLGAPAGGFWYTTTGGNNWTTTTDALPTLGVSAIVVNPHDPNTIYIGTGDRDASDAPGIGVYKSTDGGLTWSASGNGMGNAIVGCFLIDPINSLVVLAGTSAGLYRSVDGGANWTLQHTGFVKDMAFKPGNSDVVYATYSGAFLRSTDGKWLRWNR